MSKKKMLFISAFNKEIIKTNGVVKKLLLEIETFRQFGFQVDYTEISQSGVFINSSGERSLVVDWNESYHNTYVSLFKYMIKNMPDYEVIYFRYDHISFSMLSFFRKFKKMKNGIVIGELPTYMGFPYKDTSFKGKVSFYIKRFIDKVFPKYIDYLVTFSEHDRLFRIDTIKIENFIDVDSLRPKKYTNNCKTECHLLVLAQLTPAHGVDLLINGLNEYYKTKSALDIDCYVHIVGDGYILDDLKELTSSHFLEDRVFFYGALGGEELDNIFDKCDIGIGALAIFRKGSYKLSELKIREFTARCLPFVYNAYEPQIENATFCKKLDFEERSINIYEIVDFYKKMDYSEESMIKMRAFAEENFTAEFQLEPVDRIIKSNLN